METAALFPIVLSSASAVIVFMLGVIFALTRQTYASDKLAAERRLVALEEELKSERGKRERLQEQLHANDVTTTKIQGELVLVKSSHDGMLSDIEDVKRTMVTKELFEGFSTRMDDKFQSLLNLLKLQQHQGPRYPTPSPIPRVRDPRSETDPPPPRGR